MKILRQAHHLFLKNIHLRLRHWGILGLELLWPVLVMGLVALMRHGAPPFRKPNCLYQPRAMPSAGTVPFIQTYLCNLDNPCYITDSELTDAVLNTRSFSAMTQDAAPYLAAPETMNVLAISNQSIQVINTMNSVIQDQNLTQGLNTFMNVSQYFSDPEEAKRILVDEFKLFTPSEADALLNSRINVGQLMRLTGDPDFQDIACDPNKLALYLDFPKTIMTSQGQAGAASVGDVSRALCDVTQSEIPGLTDAVIRQLYVVKIMEALQLFEQLKEKFTGSSLSLLFGELADMLELVMSSRSVVLALGDLASVPEISKLIRQIPDLMQGFNNLNQGLASVSNIVDSLNPLVSSLGEADNHFWSAVQNGVKTGTHFVLLGEGRWNGTTQEFMQPMVDLVADLREIAKDGTGQIFVGALEFLSDQNWPNIYNQLIQNASLDESTMTHMLDSLEKMLQTMPHFDVVAMMSRLTQHALDVGSIFTEQTIELRQALYTAVQQSDSLQTRLNSFLMYGPAVTQSVLQSLQSSGFFAGLFTGTANYTSVCHVLMRDLETTVPADVAQEVRHAMCTEDAMETLTALLGNSPENAAVLNVINRTVELYMELYEGDFWARQVPLRELYYHYMRFSQSVTLYMDDVFKWAGIAQGAGMSGLDTNQAGWENLMVLFNEDYLIRGILGVYQGFGEVLTTTPLNDAVSPYVHLMSRAIEMTYGVMYGMTQTYSITSPLMTAASMVTGYLPELVQGVAHMAETNMDSIYKIATSGDPLLAFCSENLLVKLGMPSYVPVGDMTDLVCNTNWTQVIVKFAMPVTQVQDMVQQMAVLVDNMDKPWVAQHYDVEGDWINMVDYTQRLIDMFNSGDVGTMDFTLGYLNYFQSIDFNRLGDGVGLFLQLVMNDTAQGMRGLTGVSLGVLAGLDHSMGSNPSPEWGMVRVYASVIDSYLDMQMALTQAAANATSLQSILASFPPEFSQLTDLVARAYPDLVSSLRNMILYPEMFLDRASSLGLTAPDCQTRWLSDNFMPDRTSSLHALEMFVCGLNWEQLAQSLAVAVPEVDTYIQAVSSLTSNPTAGSTTTIDWRMLAKKVEDYVALLSTDMPTIANFDLQPFNVTDISLSWQDLYRAIDTYQNFDVNRIEGIATRLSNLGLSLTMGDSEELSALLYGNSYVTYHFLKLAISELTYFNSTDMVVLSEYLWSPELRNVLNYMKKSPDLTAVALATIQRLLVSPEQARLPTAVDAGSLCTDVQLFSEVFVVSVSSMSPADLQNFVCDVVNIDFEKALDEVQNNKASVREFIEAINVLFTNFTADDIRVDALRTAAAQETLTKLIEALIRDPPTILITLDQVWLDVSAYTAAWDRLTISLSDLAQRLNDPSSIQGYSSGLTTMLLTAAAQYPGTGPALAVIEPVLDMVVTQLDMSSGGSLEELRKYPNASVLLNLVEKAPEALQTILYTVITRQDKTSKWGFALQSWEAFCATPVDEIMSVPPDLAFSMTDFLGGACSLNLEALAAEMAASQGSDRLADVLTNGPSTNVNLTSIVDKLDMIVGYLLNQPVSTPEDILMASLPFSRLFNESVWNQLGGRMAVWADMTAASYDSPNKIVATITQSLRDAFGLLAVDVLEIVNKAIGVSDILLGQIIQIMDRNSLNASFHELPELQLLTNLVNQVPELFETVLYTALQNPERITNKLAQANSIETFCLNNPQDMLVLAPNTTFDFQDFLAQFCSLNLTKLVSDIETNTVTQQINFVLNGPYPGSLNVDSLVAKVQDLVNRLSSGISLNDRVFEPNVWSQVLDRTSTWLLADTTSPLELVSQVQQRLFQVFVAVVDNTPGLEVVYQYMDVILDLMASNSDPLDGLRSSSYPNANNLLSLLDELPEAVETVLYTVMTQPDKTSKWGMALQSWTLFCSTPVDAIMSVPPGLNFSMTGFLGRACSLDVELLSQELAAYQGSDRLVDLLTNGPNGMSVNVSSLGLKLERIVGYYATLTSATTDPMALLPFQRLFDESVWMGIGQRMEGWANMAAASFDSPTAIATTVANSLEDAFGALGTDILEIVQKAVGVSDILLGQMITLMESNSLNSSFQDLPEMQRLAGLLNGVPELFETLLYTALHHPEKITSKLAQADSIETFCLNNPQDMLVLAPNTTFDFQAFLMQFCSLNLTKLVSDIQTYTVTQQVNGALNGPYTGSLNLNSVVEKAQRLVSRLEQGVTPGDRVFNPGVWELVLSRANAWIYTAENPLDFVQLEQQRLFLALLAYVENTPGSEDMLRYVDALLDLVGDRLNQAQAGLSSSLQDLPNLSIVVSLLQNLPEMIDTAVYTVFTQPAKTAVWSQALTSLTALCSTPVSSIMTVPPGSSFNVTAYIARLCSVDTDQLSAELTSYQGFGRLEQIAVGNDTSTINTTALVLKADRFFTSLASLYANPEAALGPDLRLLDAAVWENIGQRIQGYAAATQMDLTQPESIVQAVTAVFGSLSGMLPELEPVLGQATAMAAVLVDEISLVLQATSLEDAYQGIPGLQLLIGLANRAPELYETIVYTSIFHPQKVSSQPEAFMSLEAFCTTAPDTLFAVPPNSAFDLDSWVTQFCALNFTDLESQLANYHTASAIQAIVTGQQVGGDTNLTSVIAKVTQLVERLGGAAGGGIMLQDRVLSGPVWEAAMARVNSWLANYTLDQSPLMSVAELGTVLNQLSRDPLMREALMIFTLPGVIGDVVLDKLLNVENMTSFGLVQFVQGWTSMEKILELSQRPGALEIMSASAQLPQFQALFTNQTMFVDFCTPGTDPSRYLTAPTRPVPMNLQSFQSAFCAIDFDNFMQDFNSFIDFDRIGRVLNGSEPLGWTQVFSKVDRAVQLISVKWMMSPPSFYLPPHWLNETFWENFLLGENMASLEDTQEIKTQLESAMASLAPPLQADGLRQIGLVLNAVLDLANANVVAMQNAHLTLGNAMTTIPALRGVFEVLGLDNATMSTLLAAPIQNTTQFAQLFLSDNLQADFCTSDRWRDILSLPDDFDTSPLYQAVCVYGNLDSLLEGLARAFNVETLVQALQDPTNMDNGWTSAVGKIFELVDNFRAMLENPPTLDISDPQLQATLERYVNSTDDLWGMLSAFSALQNVLPMTGSNGAGNTLGEFEAGLESVLQVPAAIVGMITELMARVKLQNGNLELASIFKDVPQVIAVVNSVLDLRPDPITGLSSITLKADTVDYFLSIAENATALGQLFCDESKFLSLFEVRPGVDLGPVLSAMCALDLDTVSQELATSLNVPSLSGNSTFNLEAFSSNLENLIGLLMNVTEIDYITFDGRDLGNVGRVNVSQLERFLTAQYNMDDLLTQDYLSLSVSILNNLLAGMGDQGNMTKFALRFIGLYMANFNSFLRTLRDKPISLQVLMNNAEVGAIVNPLLSDPQALNGLLNARVNVSKLAELLQRPDAETILCGGELWTAIMAQGAERAMLEELQSGICTANQEVALWQTVMLQANGYLIQQQLEAMNRELEQGQATLNVSAIAQEMNQFVTLVQTIIGDYMSGSRSINDLLDIQSLQRLLGSLEQNVALRLLESAEGWSIDTAQLTLPNILDNAMYQNMARTLNTANLLMNLTIHRLHGMSEGSLGFDTILANSGSLVTLIEAYLRLGQNIAGMWTHAELDAAKLRDMLRSNSSELQARCASPGGLAQDLIPDNVTMATQTVRDLATLICSVVDGSLVKQAQDFVSYDRMMQEIETIWSSPSVTPNYAAFTTNVRMFTEIVGQMANRSLAVSGTLSNPLDFGTFLQDLQNIGENPQVIFRMLQLAGLAIEGPLRENEMATQLMSNLNTFAILPIINVLDALKAKGVSLTNIDQPDKLFDVLEVMVDFKLHYQVIENVMVKSQLNMLTVWRTDLCRAFYNNETWLVMSVSDVIQPVAWSDVRTAMCNVTADADVMLAAMKAAGLTDHQIAVLMDRLSPLLSVEQLPGMYDRHLGWVELMSNLQQLTSLVTHTPVDGAGLLSMRSTWDSLKHLLLNSTTKSLFSYLSLFEKNIPPTQEWFMFRQFIQFLTSALDFVTTNMNGLVSGGRVRLEDVLPNSQRVTQLLTDVFGPSSSGEILATAVNPNMLYRMSLSNSWQELCSNSSEHFLQFPAGINTTVVIQNLCRAVATNSSSLQELLSLFNAGPMLAQLDDLLSGRTNHSTSSETIWHMAHRAILGLVDTAERLQGLNMDTQSAEAYLTPILNWANSLQTPQGTANLIGLCNSMVSLMNGTEGFQAMGQFIAPVMSSMKFVTDLTRLIPELDELTCIFFNEDGYDLTAAVDKIASVGLWQDIDEIIASLLHPSSHVECAVPFTTYMNLSEVITGAMTPMAGGLDMNMGSLQTCLSRAPAQMEEMLGSLTSTTNFLRQIIELAQMPGILDLLQNEDIVPAIEMVVQAFNVSDQVFLHLEDLLSDGNQTLNYLVNSAGLPMSLVQTFLNASVTMDLGKLLNQPDQEMANVLCDPASLALVMSLPQNLPFTVTDISQAMCNGQVLNTAAFLTNMSLSWPEMEMLQPLSDANLAALIEELAQQIGALIAEFGKVIELMTGLLTEIDLDALQDEVPVIDDLLQGKGLSRMAEIMHGILDTLVKALPASAKTNAIMDEVRRVLDGILALDALKDSLVEEIQVKDLVKDEPYLNNYLSSQLGFSDNITQTIMNAIFSSRVFLQPSEASNATCEQVLARILILNNTGMTVATVRDAVCDLTEDQIGTLLERLTPLLDIGDLVVKYVTHTTSSVLTSANVTTAELDDLVDTMDKGLVNLRMASDIITMNNGSRFLDAVLNASSMGLSMSSLSPTLCGTDVQRLFEPDFPTGSIILTSPDLASLEGVSQRDRIALEKADLPNDFCVQVYETVRNSNLGNVLWAYLKPIMRGKILYTPDTPAVREIIREANATFETFARIYEVSKMWADRAGNLKAVSDTLQDVDSLEDALQNDFVSGLVEASLGISSNSLLTSLDAVRSDNFNSSEIDALQKAAEFVANYTSCIETDRFQYVEDEEEMEREAFRLSKLKNFFAGIVFIDMEDSNSNSSSSRRKRSTRPDLPKHITYKLRMDVDNTMDTNRLKSKIWKFSAEDNFIEDMRYFRGFIHIQDMLDQAIIKLQKNEILDTPGTHISQMPFPCHHYDNFVFLLGAYLVPVMMTFVFLASLGVATHNFVYDRENGQEATLTVIGMVPGLNFLVWLVSTMLVLAVVCLVMAVMLIYTDVFQFSNLTLLFLYLLEFCFSSVMMLYMVSSFFTRTTMAILFVLMIYLISYMPYIVLIGLEVDMSFWEKRAACLSSTAAFSFGTLTLSYLEEAGVGMQWSNVRQQVTRDFSIHWAFIMMAFDSALYFLIGWYVRNVKPGKYGLSRPWYFPVLPSYWCGCLKRFIPTSFRPREEPNSGPLFEVAPSGLHVGIALQNLTKKYSGSKTKAVDNLSINFYENQVTSLLGHNGAAKTTTLKMLYGVLEPTSGKLMVNGKQPGSGDQSLGICPQQNALFDYMSVQQHMEFYMGIKGKNPSDPASRAEYRKLLSDVDLLYAKDLPVMELSYGMKRRLCVALAFVGKSKTIILDEPTSGVDPHGRKCIWNLITQNRMGRTILLSTHHLDEADILSDRIALLHQGKLLCCGSPAFLKRSIGHDFRLIVKKAEIPLQQYDNASTSSPSTKDKSTEQTETIVGYIKAMCPQAALVEQVGTDLTFNLPKNPGSMRVPLDHFFRQLDSPQCQRQLGIDTYGVSDTTLEEVFLTLTMRADAGHDTEIDQGIINPVATTKDEVITTRDPRLAANFKKEKLLFTPAAKIQYGPNAGNLGLDSAETSSSGSGDKSVRRRGLTLFLVQLGALLTKRFHHYRRNWRILMSSLALPLICLMIALFVSSLRVDEGDMKPLTLDPSIYGPDTYSFYQDSSKNAMSTGFTDTLTNRDYGYGTTCKRSWGDEYLGNNTCMAPSPWLNFTKPYYMVTCQNARQTYRKMPTSYNMYEYQAASGDYMQHVENSNVVSYLLRTFRDYVDKRFGGFTFERNEENFNSRTTEPYVWFNSKGYHSLPAFFNSMSNTILRAQLYDSKNKSEYGITAINHPIKLGKAALTVKNLEADASDAGVTIIIVIAFSFIPCGFLLYLINEKIQKERQLQSLRGVSKLTYWLVAFMWDMVIYAFTVGCAAGIVCIFKTDGFYIRQNLVAFTTILLLFGWSVIPLLYCMSKLFTSGSTAYLVCFCVNLFLALSTVISLLVMQLFTDSRNAYEAYKICRHAYLVFPQFALGQGLMDMVSNTFLYKLFERYDIDRYRDPFTTDIIAYNLIALACQGVFFFILNLILDGMRGPNAKLPSDREIYKAAVVSSEDDDVARERDRVNARGKSDDMLVVQGLSKVYRQGWTPKVAVDNITFGVPDGECFGLLGVNGAGKTTTFRMLTGDSRPAGGKAFLKGEPLSFSDKSFGHDIGYCPQEGGLDEYLTGEETLYFHARMKGFRPEQTKAMAGELLERLGLEKFANVTVHRYSGGTKRKLALAVALLGDPPILYLDEPTTGMDAVTRRLAWRCIAQANRNGQSVVLTSHSMGECDALCSRIAIMVNGQIKCIGSPQHLKNKFGDGYTLVVNAVQDKTEMVTNAILGQFPGARIKHIHLNRVELLIPYQAAQVADIIAFIQAVEDAKDIDYYSLSQTSLDSVFNSFAQEQLYNEDERYTSSSAASGTETPGGSVSSCDKPHQKPPAIFMHGYDNFGQLHESGISSGAGSSSDTPSESNGSHDNPEFVLDEPAAGERDGNVYTQMEATRL